MDIGARSGEPRSGSCREVEIINIDGFNCLSDFAKVRAKQIEEEDKAIIDTLTGFEKSITEALKYGN